MRECYRAMQFRDLGWIYGVNTGWREVHVKNSCRVAHTRPYGICVDVQAVAYRSYTTYSDCSVICSALQLQFSVVVV